MEEFLQWRMYGWPQGGPHFSLWFLCQNAKSLERWTKLRQEILHFYDEIELELCNLWEECGCEHILLRRERWSERWGNPEFGYIGTDPWYPEFWIYWQWNEKAIDMILWEGQVSEMDNGFILEMEGWYPNEEIIPRMYRHLSENGTRAIMEE